MIADLYVNTFYIFRWVHAEGELVRRSFGYVFVNLVLI